MLLHAFAFTVTLAIGALSVAVIVHMTRTYWRKALAALRMDLHPDKEIAG